MQNLNNYILEKLHINKNTKVSFSVKDKYKKGDIILGISYDASLDACFLGIFKIKEILKNKIYILNLLFDNLEGNIDYDDKNFDKYITNISLDKKNNYVFITSNDSLDILYYIKKTKQVDGNLFEIDSLKNKLLDVYYQNDIDIDVLIKKFKDAIKQS